MKLKTKLKIQNYKFVASNILEQYFSTFFKLRNLLTIIECLAEHGHFNHY